MTPDVNSFAVHTQRGVRLFKLHHGDICDSKDDVLVLSTHADEDIPLTGQVLRAVQERFHLNFDSLAPLIVPREIAGTYWFQHDDKTFLVVRFPGGHRVRSSDAATPEAYAEGVWTLFGSCAALELKGCVFHSMALPVLARRRGYPHDSLKILITGAMHWLQTSMHMARISLYIKDEEDFRRWSEEMDNILGRQFFPSVGDAELGALQAKIRSLLERVPQTGGRWSGSLDEELAKDRLSFEAVAKKSRLLVEHVTQNLLGGFGFPAEDQLEVRMKTLRKSDRIASWFLGYLYHLKTVGDKANHFIDTISYPRSETKDDLLFLLQAIHRVLTMWLDFDVAVTRQMPEP